MSLTRRSSSGAEKRSLSYQDVFGTGGNPNSNDFTGSVESALRLAPVYSATSLIADLIATSPLGAFKKTNGVRLPVARTPQLIVNPNPFGSRISWIHQGLASALLTGNAHGYKVAWDNAGTVSKIAWLDPTQVSYVRNFDPRLPGDWYWWGGKLDPALHVHVPGYTMPGSAEGLSPIGLFQRTIETGLSAEQFTLDWFNNGAAPAGHMKNTAQTLDVDDAAAAKARFKAAVSSRDVLVTGSDWDWTALAVPSDQAKFLDTIKATATIIAGIFRIQPEDIGGEPASSLTYKTLEQDGIRLNTRALRPWAARFEEALTGELPNGQDAEFNLSVNAQGTELERANGHTVRLDNGTETLDEARAEYSNAPLTAEQIAFWQANYAGKSSTLIAPDKQALD